MGRCARAQTQLLAVSCCEAGAFYLCLLCTCPLSLLHVPMPHFSTRLNLASPGPRSGGASRKPSLHVLALPCHYDSLCLPGPELFAALIHLTSPLSPASLLENCAPGQFSSVTQSCPTLCNPMNRSMPSLPVHHQLPEFTQTHVH